jgi:SAM-dependent methyltransferase
MKEFWNERYGREEYVYGTEPNAFFKAQLDRLAPGVLLLPAEGEGRNAVYAARKGWQVVAFDYAETAKEKALLLAMKYGVNIEYLLTDYEHCKFPEHSFDALALIYAHTPNWQQHYQKLFSYLKPGGWLIVELFNKKQLGNRSGGPQNPDLLVNADELKQLLGDFTSVKVWEETLSLNEGAYHKGKAEVTRCICRK